MEMENKDKLEEKTAGKMNLYTADRAGNRFIFNLREAIRWVPSSYATSVFGFHGSPGIITQDQKGRYNVHSVDISQQSFFPLNHRLKKGNLQNPDNLCKILDLFTKGEKVVTGCNVSINSLPFNSVHSWCIEVCPDYDLREIYPERFDDRLVKSLEQVAMNYIAQEEADNIATFNVSPIPAIYLFKGNPMTNHFWASEKI